MADVHDDGVEKPNDGGEDDFGDEPRGVAFGGEGGVFCGHDDEACDEANGEE